MVKILFILKIVYKGQLFNAYFFKDGPTDGKHSNDHTSVMAFTGVLVKSAVQLPALPIVNCNALVRAEPSYWIGI